MFLSPKGATRFLFVRVRRFLGAIGGSRILAAEWAHAEKGERIGWHQNRALRAADDHLKLCLVVGFRLCNSRSVQRCHGLDLLADLHAKGYLVLKLVDGNGKVILGAWRAMLDERERRGAAANRIA